MGYFGDLCKTNPVYIQKCCVEAESGSIRDVVLVPRSYQATLVAAMEAAKAAYDASPQDAADEATFLTAVDDAFAAAVVAGAFAIPAVINGSKAKPSMQEGPGAGDQDTMLVGKKHVATWSDQNIYGNGAFGYALEQRKDLILWYCTETIVWNTQVPCSIATGQIVDAAKASLVMQEYTASWSTRKNEVDYPRPTAIFECADTTAPPVTIDWVTTGPLTETVDSTFTVDVQVNNLVALDSHTKFALLAFKATAADPQKFYASSFVNNGSGSYTITLTADAALPTGAYTLWMEVYAVNGTTLYKAVTETTILAGLS